MRKHKVIQIFTVLCTVILLLSACGDTGNTPAVSPTDQANHGNNQVEATKLLDNGVIIQKSDNQWLVTKYVDKQDTSYIDAYSITVTEQTEFMNSDGQAISSADIQVGASVEVWNTGTLRESYPAQTDAARIIVLNPSVQAPNGSISQSEAFEIALKAQEGAAMARAIKSVSLDENSGLWSVEIVNYETMAESVTVYIDAQTGAIERVPVAENDTFRVFSPKPGSELGPKFVVEGEARVFEAAFSWHLEDGHNILAEGHQMADMGAPEWGKFSFEVSYETASQPNMTLILFVYSAKDGSVERELIIPLKVPEKLIKYSAEG